MDESIKPNHRSVKSKFVWETKGRDNLSKNVKTSIHPLWTKRLIVALSCKPNVWHGLPHEFTSLTFERYRVYRKWIRFDGHLDNTAPLYRWTCALVHWVFPRNLTSISSMRVKRTPTNCARKKNAMNSSFVKMNQQFIRGVILQNPWIYQTSIIFLSVSFDRVLHEKLISIFSLGEKNGNEWE